MIDHLFSLRFSAGESLLAGLAVGAIVWGVRSLLSTTAQAERSNLVAFPSRDDDEPEATDVLFDTSLVGCIRRSGPDAQVWWYSARTKAAILSAVARPTDAFLLQRVHAYARMTASTAFALHPELRETTTLVVETWPRPSRRFIHTPVIH